MKISYGNNQLIVSFKNSSSGTAAIAAAFESLRRGGVVRLECAWRDFWAYIVANFEYVKAAGGLVHDAADRWLIIHRLGCWDLPKGKAEAGETRRENALREVVEETGVEPLTIERLALKTYHIHNRYGRWCLKQTTWYQMGTPALAPTPVPQTEEEIDRAEWLPRDEWRSRLATSYATMRQIAEL